MVNHFADFGIDTVNLAISNYDMLATCINEEVRVWNIESNNPDAARFRRQKPITDVAFTPDGVQLGLACEDGSVLICEDAFTLSTMIIMNHL